MYNCVYGLNHGCRVLALEYVTSHIDTSRTVVDCLVAKFERLLLRQLLTTGNHDGYRTSGHHLLKAFAIVGLHDRGTCFGTYTGSQSKVAGIACHLLAHCRYTHYRDAVTITQINGFRFYNNNEDVCSIAYNKKSVDGTKYFACFKTQGGSKWEDSETPASRVIEVNVTGPCTITGVMASSSKSDDRELYISTAKVDSDYDKEDEAYVGCIEIKAADGAKQYTFDYQGEETTLYLYSRTGGINIYTLSVTSK